jgi:hypothetical protein
VVDAYLTHETIVEKDSIKQSHSNFDDALLFQSVNIVHKNNKKLINTGDQIKIKLKFELKKELTNPIIGINIYDQHQNCVFALNNNYHQINLGKLAVGSHHVIFTIKQYFIHGKYSLSAAICDQTKTKIYFQQNNLLSFNIVNSQYLSDGMIDFPSQITFQ